jgi:ABC-type multidrug transport system ATPase subunit
MLRLQGLEARGLAPLDLEVEAGECVALRGESGSGKTTLLRAIADLDPNGGTAAVNGTAREAMPAPQWRKLAGYLPPAPGWWADTVGEHFDDIAAAAPLAAALGLPKDVFDWPVSRLSTGEQQRLALIRLLVAGPKVLLLDEPTSGLDDKTMKAAEALLEERLHDGAAILLVTHDDAQAQRLATRALVLEDGRIREAAP